MDKYVLSSAQCALKSRENKMRENNNARFLVKGAGLALPVAILSIFLFAHNQRNLCDDRDEQNMASE